MTAYETRELAEAAIPASHEGVVKATFFGPTACQALNLYGSAWYLWDTANRKVFQS